MTIRRFALAYPRRAKPGTAAAEFLAAYRGELLAAGQTNAEAAALAAYVRSLFGNHEFLHLD